MVYEEAVTGILLNWTSLILTMYVIGVGYIGLVFIQHLRVDSIIDMPLFDKFIRCVLLGFLTFLVTLSQDKINITEEFDIFLHIGAGGLSFFIRSIITCLLISGVIYVIFYKIPNLEIEIKEKQP